MSSDAELTLEAIPNGTGLVLDLGGNQGMLRQPLEERGYRYINLDFRHFGSGEPSLLGDAHQLPFKDDALDMVVSKDTLEHFIQPWAAVKEVHRVLKTGGQFVIWVPWMHPFHEDDFYRYSPLGLRSLLKDFRSCCWRRCTPGYLSLLQRFVAHRNWCATGKMVCLFLPMPTAHSRRLF